jgi:uncharacterized protein YndB with AHSA1/START domain
MSRSPAAHAVVDLDGGIILAKIDIAAPPERVYRALTDAAEVPTWWGAPEVYRTESWAADLRVGGAWKATSRSVDGTLFVVGGEYLALDPPRRIVQSWRADWDGGAETRLTITIDPVAAGSRVTVRHEGFAGRRDSCADHGAGWEQVLEWLAKHLAPPRASATR